MTGPDIYICDAVRTARGKARESGGLHAVKPVDLVGTLLKALAGRQTFDTRNIGDVILGCVTQTGDQGGNVARTALLCAGWPDTVPGISINRFCTSGLDAAVMAAGKIAAGVEDVNIAGGVESMSRTPMMADKGAYYVDPDVSRRSRFLPLGIAADLIATLDGISRTDADAYAAESQRRATAAQAEGRFDRSIIGVENPTLGMLITRDEVIRPGNTADELAKLPPAFIELGAKGFDDLALGVHPELAAIEHIHHAGNSPAMADGASLVILASRTGLDAIDLRPRARIRSMVNMSVDPVTMLTGGIVAAQAAIERAGLVGADIDLAEFNESFAAVAIKFMNETDLAHDRVNVNGGAIAMGHAMGSTGTTLIGTVLDELERRDQSIGLIAISGGAGVGTAMVIERV